MSARQTIAARRAAPKPAVQTSVPRKNRPVKGRAWRMNAVFACFAEGGETVTPRQLALATGLSEYRAVETCGALIARGLIARKQTGLLALTAEGKRARAAGETIGTGRRPGIAVPQAPAKDSLRQRAWAAMRVFGSFSTADLAVAAEDRPTSKGLRNLQHYLSVLVQTGHVAELPTRDAHVKKGSKRYRLLINAGQFAPVHRPAKAEVHDPNSGEVYPCRAI